LIHLDQGNESKFSVMWNNQSRNTPLLVRDLLRNSDNVIIISCVVDRAGVEELEEVFVKHPKSTIVFIYSVVEGWL